MPIHTKFPNIVVKKSTLWKLKEFDITKEANATKMVRFLVDAIFERDAILNMNLEELIKKEKEKMTFLLSYVTSCFKLTTTAKIRAAISDKLGHLPGRKRPKKNKKSVTTSGAYVNSSQDPTDSISQSSQGATNASPIQASSSESQSQPSQNSLWDEFKSKEIHKYL